MRAVAAARGSSPRSRSASTPSPSTARAQTTVAIKDPCQDRDIPDSGGLGGFVQGLSLEALDRAACDIGSSREELLLAIFDDKLHDEFDDKYGKDPRNPLDVGAALLGL